MAVALFGQVSRALAPEGARVGRYLRGSDPEEESNVLPQREEKRSRLVAQKNPHLEEPAHQVGPLAVAER
jgi:hypothetical protein